MSWTGSSVVRRPQELPGVKPLSAKLQPEHFQRLLRRRSAVRRWKVIVLAREGREAEVAGLIDSLGRFSKVGPPGTERLDLICGLAATVAARNVFQLAESDAVEAIWHVDEAVYKPYVRVIKALGVFVADTLGPAVVNLSLGPAPHLLAMEFDAAEPLSLATRRVAEANKVIVVAAGNDGPQENTLNPWSVAPWVISVGAASRDATRLADFSSRGRKGDPLYRPTVVAPGVDIMVPRPPAIPKTEAELEAEARTDFQQVIPRDLWPHYTVVSGTSFAAAEVSRTAVQIIHFLQSARDDLARRRGPVPRPTFAQFYNHSQSEKSDERITSHRLVGVHADYGNVRSVHYPLEASPVVVKQILLDLAVGMPGYQPHEAGAGLVARELAEHYFGAYGIVNPSLGVYKVL